MCGICGCSDDDTHDHAHEHGHTHDHIDSSQSIISIEENLLAKNNQFADINKAYFSKHQILTCNLMSSPGAGKTTLLSKTMSALKDKFNCATIVGDQHTDEDAKQLQTSGSPAIQVNTGQVCHLDAHMVGHALEKVPLKPNMLLFIENVGNLVCPSLFHLGERYKIVILSVTEGENKPIKYPHMFRAADLLLITKMDLLPYVDFNLEKCIAYARNVKPHLEVIPLSVKQNQGLEVWYHWLFERQQRQ